MTNFKAFAVGAGARGLLLILGLIIGPKFSLAEGPPVMFTITRIKDGMDLVVAISYSGKTVYALSDVTGKWAKLSVDGVVMPGKVTIDKGTAVFISGKYAYGFSAVTGAWSQVAFEGKPSLEIVAGNSLGCFVAGTKAYVFSGQTGTWSELELGAEKAVPQFNKRLQITLGSKIYVFSKATNEWVKWDLAED